MEMSAFAPPWEGGSGWLAPGFGGGFGGRPGRRKFVNLGLSARATERGPHRSELLRWGLCVTRPGALPVEQLRAHPLSAAAPFGGRPFWDKKTPEHIAMCVLPSPPGPSSEVHARRPERTLEHRNYRLPAAARNAIFPKGSAKKKTPFFNFFPLPGGALQREREVSF